MLIIDKVFLMRDAGVVKRSHTCRTLMDRNVAEHSHGVAMLVLLLYQEAGAMPSANLLAAALTHDLSEIATGDIPAPVKRDNTDVKRAMHRISHEWEENHGIRFDLTNEEATLLLWCDRMDFALFSLEEVTMGNRFFLEYLHRIIGWLQGMDCPMPECDTLAAGFMRRANKHLQEYGYEC
jgi:hypothetical protein